jgi:hypothetical protein
MNKQKQFKNIFTTKRTPFGKIKVISRQPYKGRI